LEINKTVIVASRWFLYYFTYIDDARSNTNKVIKTKKLQTRWWNLDLWRTHVTLKLVKSELFLPCVFLYHVLQV